MLLLSGAEGSLRTRSASIFSATDGSITEIVHVRAENYERCEECGHEDYEVRAKHYEGELWWRIVQICLNRGDAFTTLREDTRGGRCRSSTRPGRKRTGRLVSRPQRRHKRFVGVSYGRARPYF
jgi:hypothetical protein